MRYKHFLPATGWLFVITGLSVMPGVQLPKFDLFSTDKLVHAAVYAILTWLLLSAAPPSSGRKTAWWPPVFAAAYGALMEYIQYAFVPGRFCEFDDMLANAAGCLVAWIGVRWWRSRT